MRFAASLCKTFSISSSISLFFNRAAYLVLSFDDTNNNIKMLAVIKKYQKNFSRASFQCLNISYEILCFSFQHEDYLYNRPLPSLPRPVLLHTRHTCSKVSSHCLLIFNGLCPLDELVRRRVLG